MRLLILSDIHGNLSALTAVLSVVKERSVDRVALLGDLIDYCPHSNEVISSISSLALPVVCNIWGNHENAIVTEDFSRFSSSRGTDSARYTKSILTDKTREYITGKMSRGGVQKFVLDERKFLAVHGTLEDEYWGKFDCAKDLSAYAEYDVVLMGHSHRPIFYEAFFSCDDERRRGQKKTIFINPGSVGQPRNLCPHSQLAVFDTESETCEFMKIPYDIKKEQQGFSDRIDSFYKTRLEAGI